MNYLLLLFYFLLATFSNGIFTTPLFSWLAPIFLLRFMREQNSLKSTLSALGVCFLTNCIFCIGFAPVEGIFYFLIMFGFALLYWLPFQIDIFLSKYLPGSLSILILPLSFTLLEYINMTFNPYGIYCSTGLTQLGHPQFAQIASITGRFGITFLVFLFASFINYLWQNNWELKKIKKMIITIGLIYFLVLVYGNIRLHLFHNKKNTVRVAGICPENIDKRFKDESFWEIYIKLFFHKQISKKELNYFFSLEEDYKNQLYDLTIKEAETGSKIIVWGESAFFQLNEDEINFKNKIQKIANKYNIYILATSFTIYIKDDAPVHNKAYFFRPYDSILEYTKSVIGPGDLQKKGDKNFFMAKTPYGNLSSFICFDQTDIHYVQKFKNADIIMNPSDDWKEINPYNSLMLQLSAIEHGFNIIRPTIEGLSIIYDYKGRLITQGDDFTMSPNVIVGQVPIKGVLTIYDIIGDLFIFLCIISSIILIILAIYLNKK
jgi:apolipoprotein N-acyltransferase